MSPILVPFRPPPLALRTPSEPTSASGDIRQIALSGGLYWGRALGSANYRTHM